MEYSRNEEGLLDELLGLREIEYYTNQDFSTSSGWKSILEEFSSYNKSAFPTNIPCAPFGEELSPPHFTSDSSNTNIDSQTCPHYYSMSIFDHDDATGSLLDIGAPCKVEPVPTFKMGFAGHDESERKNKVKKLNGQPSKNLMAERRRRKRLNDRLSMLRSVVPNISKMDRTSILRDTIAYMKELVERINKLQEEMDVRENQLGLSSIFKNLKPPPKFDVERRNSDTRIEICCAGKPGLLLSTVTTIEAFGMDIQQCVISCFNDFAMQASCTDEEMKQRTVLDSEDIKQALFRNAGYGGRCP